MAEFTKIEKKRKSTYAAEQIVEAIRRGAYHVGDKLPPEREIAAQMGVSRPSVREALSALQLVGIVESRAGDGTYVLSNMVGLEEGYRALSLLEESESLYEAFEARRVLEEGIAGLVCNKATSKDLQALETSLTAMRQTADVRNFDAFNRANQGFHLTLVTATHNSLLVRALEPLLEVMGQRLPRQLREKYYRSDSQRFRETFEIHRRIFQAIEQRDRVQAVFEMGQHFDALETDLNA
ncbi:MAG: FadR/GntR family transcriptional regulator [Candidatus Bipolaricaulia bacterium]